MGAVNLLAAGRVRPTVSDTNRCPSCPHRTDCPEYLALPWIHPSQTACVYMRRWRLLAIPVNFRSTVKLLILEVLDGTVCRRTPQGPADHAAASGTATTWAQVAKAWARAVR
jgi:hypothetical protein